MLSARNEIVRLLLGLPSLQRFVEIDGFESATNEKETTEPGIALDVEVTRAPISPLRAAITRCAGPEILKEGEPEPADSTPGIPDVNETNEALEYPHTRSVSTALTFSRGRNTECARGSVETEAGTAIRMN
jgi:hypothetical protein